MWSAIFTLHRCTTWTDPAPLVPHSNKNALSCLNMLLAFCLQLGNDFLQVFKEQTWVRVNSIFNLTRTKLWLKGMEVQFIQYVVVSVKHSVVKTLKINMFRQISSGQRTLKTRVVKIRHDLRQNDILRGSNFHLCWIQIFFACTLTEKSVLLDLLVSHLEDS